MVRRLASLAAAGLIVASMPAQAAITVTYFGPASWSSSDATLGVAGYRVEDFEDTTLASGLRISRQNGAVGNFPATAVLPGTSVFDPATDPSPVVQALLRGIWDGSHVLTNHPGPSFAGTLDNWYSDGANWADLEFLFPAGTTSVGFSLQQMAQANNQLVVNGLTLSTDLMSAFAALGDDFEPFSGGFFRSRNGYLRIDATGGDTIQSVFLDNGSVSVFGDGMTIDHLAFQVPEPATLGLLGLGVIGVGVVRRRRG